MTNDNFIKSSLETLLGIRLTNQTIQENTEGDRKGFCKLVDQLEKLVDAERAMYQDYGVDTNSLVEPYWNAIEDIIDFTCEPDVAEVLWWYLHSRKGKKGEVIAWEDVDGDGKTYIFKKSSELFDYINRK